MVFALLCAIATSVTASSNWESSNNLVWMNDDSTLCWRDSNWTPATSAPECDGALKPVALDSVTTTKVTLQADTLFDFDKSVIKPDGKLVLDKLLAKLNAIKVSVIIAVGNTDSIGTDAYNIALGYRRANAVKAYLVSKGIPLNDIYTDSLGKSNPVASNATPQGRAKNRRVEVEVIGIE